MFQWQYSPDKDEMPVVIQCCAEDDGGYNQMCTFIYRGSNMIAHVLLILLNELGKRDEMRGLPSILSLFCNKFN